MLMGDGRRHCVTLKTEIARIHTNLNEDVTKAVIIKKCNIKEFDKKENDKWDYLLDSK